MALDRFVSGSAIVMEIAGILAMVVGSFVALGIGLGERRRGGRMVYRAFRNHLGKAILLGLELLVAADIIRTVSEIPSLEQVLVLAMIVLIRTFLSFALQIELEGKLPWRRFEGPQPRE